jgi:hypothetical protein
MDRLSAREYPGAVFTCFHILSRVRLGVKGGLPELWDQYSAVQKIFLGMILAVGYVILMG